MSNESEKLKVIFFEPASDGNGGLIVADSYFSFSPTFQSGDAINLTLSKRNATNAVVHDPIGHKTHQVLSTDWVVMIDEVTKEALATLIVSVAKVVPKTGDTARGASVNESANPLAGY
ncbi:MAG: hypothetical protein JWP57_2768 [Spirosoma sp.]|nr:hypothetical protein [Spirosoma sp.]